MRSDDEGLELSPGEDVQIPINFRATLKGDFCVRFLFRYETIPVNGSTSADDLPSTCRFRFQRMLIYINS